MLKRNANNDKTVILAVVDNSYVEMAINLLGYFHGKNIRNFLFICTDEESALRLKRYGIYPFLYENALVSKTASVFRSIEFKKKTAIKIKMVTAALMLGFNALLTDVDIVFLRNPIPHITLDTDIAIQDDLGSGLNAGFMLVRPTYAGVLLMQKTLESIVNERMMTQEALNKAINGMLSSNMINVRVLNKDLFPCGVIYFEDKKHMFLGDNSKDKEPYLIHNNYILTKVLVEICIYLYDLLNLTRVSTPSSSS